MNIFPTGLEGTLLVPVLVGVLVMAALHEWWGWDFVGLVVPGYLCSVLLIEPVVAVVVLVEALAAWGLARAIDALGVRLGLTFPVFGRDRFFLVLVASVMVRILLEAFTLQPLAALAAQRFGAIAAHRNELFGVGLVLVPLTANRLWRPGPRRALFQLGVQTALVYLVVGVALTRLTNFSLGGFELAYDHLALSFLSSPQAQITLLATAALASFLNRRYGWDFHGILVPALLALAVATPLRLAATLVEALAVMGLARALLWLPGLRRLSIEGSRKVVLCFVVGFVLKLALAAALSAHWPGFRPADFFGFGYLLPSLLAERLWQKERPALVLLPVAQAALLGVALGAGALRALLAVAPAAVAAAAPQPVGPAPSAGGVQATEIATWPWALAQLPRGAEGTAVPSPGDLLLAAVRIQESRADVAALDLGLRPLGLSLSKTSDGSLVAGGPGWPVIVLRPRPAAVVASAHADEVGVAPTALWAADLLGADVVLASREGDTAAALATALHARARTPLVLVRGAALVPGGDALLVLQPAPVGVPPWLTPLGQALDARLALSRERGPAAAALHAFPPGAGRRAPAALLWLSPAGRWALTGSQAAWLQRPELLALAGSRGLGHERADVAAWVAAGHGAPSAGAVAAAEALARTRDMARLVPVAGARLVVLTDEGHGLVAVGVEEEGRRAASVLGVRREERLSATDLAAARHALAIGARTVIAEPSS